MQSNIDTWFLESIFTHFKRAAYLVNHIGDISLADDLVTSIKEMSRRVAELLGEPSVSREAAKPSDAEAAGETTKGDESDELKLAKMLDDLCDSVARADAFTSAAQHLIREILAKDERENRQIAQLAQLVDATSDAMWEADDVGHVLVVEFAQRRRGHGRAS